MPSTRDLWLGAVVAVIVLGGCALEAWRDRTAGVDRGTILKGWVLVLIAFLIIAGAMLGARYAHARDVGYGLSDVLGLQARRLPGSMT